MVIHSTPGSYYERNTFIAQFLTCIKSDVALFESALTKNFLYSRYTAGLGGMTALGIGAPNSAFTAMSTIFGLSVICGYHR